MECSICNLILLTVRHYIITAVCKLTLHKIRTNHSTRDILHINYSVRLWLCELHEFVLTFVKQREKCSIQRRYQLLSAVPNPVVARSKAWACGHSLAAIAGSNSAGDMAVYLL